MRLGSQTLALDDEAVTAHPALEHYAGREIDPRASGPEDLEDAALVPDAPPRTGGCTGKVELHRGARLRGHRALLDRRGARASPRRSRELAGATSAPIARPARPSRPTAAGAVIVGRFGPRSRVRDGDPVEVAVDTRTLHFFDPETVSGSTTNPA